jgi:hypothetical protein
MELERYSDEARRLAGSDPSVQAGRMAVEVFNWFTTKGAVSFAS